MRAGNRLIRLQEGLTKVQNRQKVPYFIGSFSTMVDEGWAYRGMEDYLEMFARTGWSWSMWTYKRIDDPLEYALWGTTTAWGLWQRMEAPDWVRADVWLDDKATLEANLSRYTSDRMVPNERLLEILSSHL